LNGFGHGDLVGCKKRQPDDHNRFVSGAGFSDEPIRRREMVDAHGSFVWYELMTPDVEAAKAFYAEVVGWGTKEASVPSMAYTSFTVGETPVCGLLALPAGARQAGARPFWIGYIGVEDVDAAANLVNTLGGRVYVPPKDIPCISRFSVFADPQQAMVGLLKWVKKRSEPPVEPGARGGIGWHELLATDWGTAWSYYSSLLGWRKMRAEAGSLGTYQQFSAGGQTTGGIVSKPPFVPVPIWLYYFNIGDIDAAVKRVTGNGGKTLSSPMRMPDGRWGVQCTDPQGAMFALVGVRSPADVGKPRYDTITVYKVDHGKRSNTTVSPDAAAH
jgi:predicted enzyme related to lactoylglutathione lyase